MALNLFGVTVNDAHMAQVSVADTETIVVRDLAAICGQVEYREPQLDDASIGRLSEVIEAFGARGPVLPKSTSLPPLNRYPASMKTAANPI